MVARPGQTVNAPARAAESAGSSQAARTGESAKNVEDVPPRDEVAGRYFLAA
jgi:hypothetical protein